MQEPVKEAGTIVLTVMVRETKFIFFKENHSVLNVTCKQKLHFGANLYFLYALKNKGYFFGIDGSLNNL